MRALVASCYAVIGLVLGVVLDHSFRQFSVIIRQPWYESLWVPFWAACLVFLVASVWVRLPMPASAILGLLVTGPPYGWILVVYLRESGGLDGFAALLICLALSGAVLNPLMAGVVSVIGRRLGLPGFLQSSHRGARA